jgi:hypothetical protein
MGNELSGIKQLGTWRTSAKQAIAQVWQEKESQYIANDVGHYHPNRKEVGLGR